MEQPCPRLTPARLPKLQATWAREGQRRVFKTLGKLRYARPGSHLRGHRGKGGAARSAGAPAEGRTLALRASRPRQQLTVQPVQNRPGLRTPKDPLVLQLGSPGSLP